MKENTLPFCIFLLVLRPPTFHQRLASFLYLKQAEKMSQCNTRQKKVLGGIVKHKLKRFIEQVGECIQLGYNL